MNIDPVLLPENASRERSHACIPLECLFRSMPHGPTFARSVSMLLHNIVAHFEGRCS